MIICLIVICYLFGFTMIYSVCEYGWFKMVGLYFFTLKLLLIIDIMCIAPALRILSALCWFQHLILIKDKSYWHMLQYRWLVHVEVYAWVCALECSWLSFCTHCDDVLWISIIDRLFYPFLIWAISFNVWISTEYGLNGDIVLCSFQLY